MKTVTQWFENTLAGLAYDKKGFKTIAMLLMIAGFGALSLYILLNSPA